MNNPKILDSNISIRNENLKCTKNILLSSEQKEMKIENAFLKRIMKKNRENKKHIYCHSAHEIRQDNTLIARFV